MKSFRRMLPDLLQSAFKEDRTRAPGLHASMAGKCPRAVLAALLSERPSVELDVSTKGVFVLGHAIDRIAKDAITGGLYDTNGQHLIPLDTHHVVTVVNGIPIHGETDRTIIDLKAKKLYIVDFKSSDPDSWWNIKREDDVKDRNAMQVATYMMSTQYAKLCQDMGLQAEGYLMYLSKSNLLPLVYKVKPHHLENALSYWEDLTSMYRARLIPQIGNDVVMVPQESWECGYCDLWPSLSMEEFRTKSDVKKARSVHRDTCFRTCMMTQFEPVRAIVDDVVDDTSDPMDDMTEVQA